MFSKTAASSSQGPAHSSQIQAWMGAQNARMEKAAQEEKQRKAEASRKRPPSAVPSQDGPDSKRAKLEDAAISAAFLAGFDFTKLPAALVTDLIVANLQAFAEETLDGLVQSYRQGRGASLSEATPGPSAPTALIPSTKAEPAVAASSVPVDPVAPPERIPSGLATPVPEYTRRASRSPSRSKTPPTPPPVKEEDPVDPLQMDIDEEELEYEPDKLNLEVTPTIDCAVEAAI